MSKKKNRKNQPVTFELLTEFYVEFLKPEFEKLAKLIGKNSQQIKTNSQKIDRIDVKLDKLEDQFEGLKAEFSDTPSLRQFNKLKQKVKAFHTS